MYRIAGVFGIRGLEFSDPLYEEKQGVLVRDWKGQKLEAEQEGIALALLKGMTESMEYERREGEELPNRLRIKVKSIHGAGDTHCING